MAEYIEMLNEGYVPKSNDPETEFSDGGKANQFWKTNKDKIIKELETNQKYETGYEKARQAVTNYLEKSEKRSSISPEDKVKEYIEMLNEGYVPKSNDPETEFSDGGKVNYFWQDNRDKIKKELETNPKYETGYEKAKQTVKSRIEKSSRRKIKEIKNLENDTENNKKTARS